MLFEDLNLISPIYKALKNEGYIKPTPIQEQAIPPILQGKDFLLRPDRYWQNSCFCYSCIAAL